MNSVRYKTMSVVATIMQYFVDIIHSKLNDVQICQYRNGIQVFKYLAMIIDKYYKIISSKLIDLIFKRFATYFDKKLSRKFL